MNLLKGIWEELIGLFVDDWAFALLVLAWVGIFGLAHGRLPTWLFFAGIAALVLAFTARRARAARRG